MTNHNSTVIVIKCLWYYYQKHFRRTKYIK